MKAALGGVSADGMGTPELDVPQSGGDPCAFVAIQPGGNAGGASPSKFSLSTNGIIQGGEHEGVGNLLTTLAGPPTLQKSVRLCVGLSHARNSSQPPLMQPRQLPQSQMTGCASLSQFIALCRCPWRVNSAETIFFYGNHFTTRRAAIETREIFSHCRGVRRRSRATKLLHLPLCEGIDDFAVGSV
jgi:hypothetical protein